MRREMPSSPSDPGDREPEPQPEKKPEPPGGKGAGPQPEKKPEPETKPGPGPGAKRRRPFERWRKIMILGSLVLLATSIAAAVLKEDMPRVVHSAGYVTGYILLAYGFMTFYRSRPDPKKPPQRKP